MMLINQYTSLFIFSFTAKNINNIKQENLDITALQLANKLMITIAITQPQPLPKPYTIMQGKKICPVCICPTENLK